MNLKLLRKLSVLLVCMLLGLIVVKGEAWAKDKEKRRTSINFEDELIEGELKKPEVMMLFQRKQFNFKRLIKLRDNFLPEMQRTAEDLKRARGQK